MPEEEEALQLMQRNLSVLSREISKFSAAYVTLLDDATAIIDGMQCEMEKLRQDAAGGHAKGGDKKP